MIIQIETIPHNQQRYDTCGDYFTDPMGVRQFRISETGNPDYNFLVLLHEMIEAHLCGKRDITDTEIDEFDNEFAEDGEPGDHPDAPYYREHQFATAVERLMAVELGVNWNAYDDTITRLK